MKKNTELSEFDKVYIVKYIDIIGEWQITKDLNITQKQVENVVVELKNNGLYEVYNSLSDYEWEKLEKMKKEDILKVYLPKTKNNNTKSVKELFELFNVNIAETIIKFPLYNYMECDFKFDYFKQEDYENEEWKKIGQLDYLVSNYGRIKNIKTKKLKALRNNRFGYQINLWHNGKGTMFTISRLVAHYFVRPVKDNERVKHIDGKIKNNYYKNLEIVCK